MGTKIEFRNRADRELHKNDWAPRRTDTHEAHVGELEARLQDLSDRLPNFDAEPEIVSLKGRPHIYDPSLDMRVKVDAVRWMLRVAKHVQDPARKQILLTVTSSLDQLERAVNEHPHAA